jgi:hypothetical protein
MLEVFFAEQLLAVVVKHEGDPSGSVRRAGRLIPAAAGSEAGLTLRPPPLPGPDRRHREWKSRTDRRARSSRSPSKITQPIHAPPTVRSVDRG